MSFLLRVGPLCPSPPRPAVLPVPLACPRPTLFFSFTPPPRGGVSLVSSFMFRISILQIKRRARRARRDFFVWPYRNPKNLGVLGVGSQALAPFAAAR